MKKKSPKLVLSPTPIAEKGLFNRSSADFKFILFVA